MDEKSSEQQGAGMRKTDRSPSKSPDVKTKDPSPFPVVAQPPAKVPLKPTGDDEITLFTIYFARFGAILLDLFGKLRSSHVRPRPST